MKRTHVGLLLVSLVALFGWPAGAQAKATDDAVDAEQWLHRDADSPSMHRRAEGRHLDV